MNIKWFGHSAFLITTDTGIRVIMDPYLSGAFDGALAYEKISEEADIVLSSHNHDDHNYTGDIGGKFRLINRAGDYEERGITIRGIPTFHDQSGGNERGTNIIYVIEADGMKIAHLGDLGHILDTHTVGKIGELDILLVPVGGFYTIDASEASRVVDAIQPTVAIPMHFRTSKCTFPISSVDDFTKGKTPVSIPGKSQIDISKTQLQSIKGILVLDHAL